MPWWHRRRNPFHGIDFLELIPERRVEHETDAAGDLVLLLPRFRDPVGRRLLQPRLPAPRRWVRVRVDARGACLWLAVDGTRALRELVPVYVEAFPADRGEAAERVSRWFYAAYEHGLVLFVNLDAGGDAPG